MPTTPIGFGPAEPQSWYLSWKGHRGASDDPQYTQTQGKPPTGAPPAPPQPPPPPPQAAPLNPSVGPFSNGQPEHAMVELQEHIAKSTARGTHAVPGNTGEIFFPLP
jgi:hypothetical protein